MERKIHKRRKKTDEERARIAGERGKYLKCPLCGETPGVPMDIDTPFGGEVEGGRCGCGAVYVYDRTGRMLGEAFTEALVMAFDWDYDAAFQAPEGSYEEGVIRYNTRSNQFFKGEGDTRDRCARFYFIRRKKTD
jgi:hypothetical protein